MDNQGWNLYYTVLTEFEGEKWLWVGTMPELEYGSIYRMSEMIKRANEEKRGIIEVEMNEGVKNSIMMNQAPWLINNTK